MIDEITDKGYAKRIFNKEVKIDGKSIVAAGHCQGGATCIALGRLDKRVSAVVSLDPWFFPIQSEIQKNKFKFNSSQPPLLIIPTMTFASK